MMDTRDRLLAELRIRAGELNLIRFAAAEGDWGKSTGPRGGTVWVHSGTGAKRYQKNKPGHSPRVAKDHPAAVKPEAKKRAFRTKPGAAKPVAAPTKTVSRQPHEWWSGLSREERKTALEIVTPGNYLGSSGEQSLGRSLNAMDRHQAALVREAHAGALDAHQKREAATRAKTPTPAAPATASPAKTSPHKAAPLLEKIASEGSVDLAELRGAMAQAMPGASFDEAVLAMEEAGLISLSRDYAANNPDVASKPYVKEGEYTFTSAATTNELRDAVEKGKLPQLLAKVLGGKVEPAAAPVPTGAPKPTQRAGFVAPVKPGRPVTVPPAKKRAFRKPGVADWARTQGPAPTRRGMRASTLSLSDEAMRPALLYLLHQRASQLGLT